MKPESLDDLELPSTLRQRRINELFNEVRKDGIDGWAYLANCLFFAIARHHGEAMARRIFNESGPMPKRLRAALRNASVLGRFDKMKNVAKLARELAEENKKLPKEQQRGAGGTDAIALSDHIRTLIKARKRWIKAHPLFASLPKR
jgi:hypothetical protein